MKLAKALKFILTLSLFLFTLSSKSDKKVQILKNINDLIAKYNAEESKSSGKSYTEIETLQDKTYKLIEEGDKEDKEAALQEITDKDENYYTYNFYMRIEEIQHRPNFIGTQADFNGESYDLDKLKVEHFIQGANKSACVLYSALYGITQNPVLKNDLKSLIKITKNDIVVKLGASSFFKIPKFYAKQQKGSDLHPSQKKVLVAIGESILLNLKTSLGVLSNYVITNDGKDVLWHKDIVEIASSNFDKIDFSQDGSLVIKSTPQNKYKGDFVVSIGTDRYKGHAISAFFRSGKWVLFDNMIGELPITDLKKNYKVTSMVLIGKMQKESRRKLK